MPDTKIEVMQEGFTVIRQSITRNPDLDTLALGLMCKMLSLPPDWDYSVAGLAAITGLGRDTVRKKLKVLEKAGYLVRRGQVKKEGGKFGSAVYELSDIARPPLTDLPSTVAPPTVQPMTVPPLTEKSAQLSTKELNTKKVNTPLPPSGGKRVPKHLPERFEDFWGYYRKHSNGNPGNRISAVKAWDKLKPDNALINTIASALVNQVKTERWLRGIGIPYASSWLNGRRWEDEVVENATSIPTAKLPEIRFGVD